MIRHCRGLQPCLPKGGRTHPTTYECFYPLALGKHHRDNVNHDKESWCVLMLSRWMITPLGSVVGCYEKLQDWCQEHPRRMWKMRNMSASSWRRFSKAAHTHAVITLGWQVGTMDAIICFETQPTMYTQNRQKWCLLSHTVLCKANFSVVDLVLQPGYKTSLQT